jgi:hypothetical protein
MRQAKYKQQAMHTIQQSKKVSVKTCVAKMRNTKEKKKKKKKSPCLFLTCRQARNEDRGL